MIRGAHKLPLFFTIAFGWAIVGGVLIWLLRIKLGSILGVGALAFFYMPAPAVAALIVERGIARISHTAN